VARTPSVPSLTNLSWLDDLSLEQLAKVIEAAQAQHERKREEVRDQLRQEVMEKVRLLGLDPEDLFAIHKRRGNRSSVNARSTVKPKYRDNRDPTQTWSGRGRLPRWLHERVKAGENKDDYLIQ
jgi:DNA-binding protein H-NS